MCVVGHSKNELCVFTEASNFAQAKIPRLSEIETTHVTKIYHGKALTKAIRGNLQQIIEYVDCDDVITFLYQEQAITTEEYQTVQVEQVSNKKVCLILHHYS